jgi:hypothetical protein
MSEFNQRAYEIFLRPAVKAAASEVTAKLARQFHPLRFQRWAVSDLNPFLAWLGPAAQRVKAQRQALPKDDLLRRAEALNAELTSAALDYYRAVRDAVTESAFFSTYAGMYDAYLADADAAQDVEKARRAEAGERPFVKEALANIDRGGYTEAFARVAYLLSRKGEPLPLSRLTMRQELAKDYNYMLPDIALDKWRRIRGEQEIVVRYAPERALETLPSLLDDDERTRLITLLERVLADKRVMQSKPTAGQMAMYERVRSVLGEKGSPPPTSRLEVAIERVEGASRKA